MEKGDVFEYGKYGIKEKVNVLRWVSSKINRLNGKKKRVKIFGEGEGDESVK
jgi:carboxylesterase type B